MRVNNTEIIIKKGMSLDQDADAIVLSLSKNCQLAARDVEFLGEDVSKSLLEVFLKNAAISPEKAIYLISDYFKAKSVIAVVCDFFDISDPEDYLRRCYEKIFHRVKQQKIKTIVFPALGVHQELLPMRGVAKIMAQEVLRFVRNDGRDLESLIICIDDDENFECFNQTIMGYLNHIENNLGKGPYVTVDVIIEMWNGLILIERSNPPYGWALPGGFVDVGESCETAAIREVKEETHLKLDQLKQFHVYSDAKRDPRFHSASVVFTAQGKGSPLAGDDAKAIKTVAYEELLEQKYAFDHFDIIKDYLDRRWG